MVDAPRRAFVVAHYDPAGRVARHLRELVAHLASSSRVVFVSTQLADDHGLPNGVEVITRPNEGYDFSSYKRGIEALGDLAAVDQLVTLNSSFVCLDPARLTERFFARSRPEIDVLGLTANLEIAPHLQSYWISFENRRALDSPAFSRWWTTLEPVSGKSQVILRYEVGMSHALDSAGLKLASAFSPTREEKLRVVMRSYEASGRLPPVGADGKAHFDTRLADGLNPTHFFWDSLLEEFAVVKMELLRKNPFRLDLAKLHATLAARPQWRALVDDALAAP
jgi:lipopolysaccharide biosynthesis protein